jgi:hypothetical protein
MYQKNSGVPEKPLLSSLESEILLFVSDSWPSSALEVAEHFHADLSSPEAVKRASAKFSYYLQKLVSKQLLLSKRIGNALVVWPLQVEKYRAIHQILTTEHPVQQSLSDSIESEEELVLASQLLPVKGVS